MLTLKEREDQVLEHTLDLKSWETLIVSMVPSLWIKYKYFSTLEKILDHPRSDTPIQTRSMTIEMSPRWTDIDHSMDLIKTWMLENEKTAIQDFFQESRVSVTWSDLKSLCDKNWTALVHPSMKDRVQKRYPDLEIVTTPFAPTNKVVLFGQGRSTVGGWELVGFDIKVKNLLCKDEITEQYGALLEATMSWQDDHLSRIPYTLLVKDE